MPDPFRSDLRAALAALALLALVGCRSEAVEVADELPRPVRTLVVAPQPVAATLSLPAEIRPRVETRYGFRLAGKLAQRPVSVGDRVAAGQVLAKLDPADVTPAIAAQQAQVDAARTELELARVELARQRDLRERSYISQAALDRQQAAFDAAGARLESARAQLRQARNALDFQTLRAEAAGVVTGVEVEVGQVVAAGQAVVRVARSGELEALVHVPERDLPLARSAPGWRITIAAAGRELPGVLRELAPLADAATRSYAARLAIDGDAGGVQLGMSAVATAQGAPAPGIVLPLAALHSRDATPRVWVVDRATMTVSAVEVRIADLLDESARIAAGVAPGDVVVTAGANLLREGQKVRLLSR